MSDWRLRLLPREKREWGEACLAEFGDQARLGRLIVDAWYLTIKGGQAMKTVVATMSIVNAAFGLFVLGLFVVTRPNPLTMALIGFSILLQGAYTLWFLTDKGDRFEPWPTRLLLSGETLALLVGTGALVVSAFQLSNGVADPEYGPIAAAGLIVAQAGATIYAHAIRRDREMIPGTG